MLDSWLMVNCSIKSTHRQQVSWLVGFLNGGYCITAISYLHQPWGIKLPFPEVFLNRCKWRAWSWCKNPSKSIQSTDVTLVTTFWHAHGDTKRPLPDPIGAEFLFQQWAGILFQNDGRRGALISWWRINHIIAHWCDPGPIVLTRGQWHKGSL